MNILLVDYHRLICEDALLPAGRMREPENGKSRAHIVIVTKWPKDITPMDLRVLSKQMELYPYQQLYCTTLTYGCLLYTSTNNRATSALTDSDPYLHESAIISLHAERIWIAGREYIWD